ncbi:histone H2A-Bbd type 1-like [Dermatophagoides farinae]|uniref:Histone H2A n=1 Tax=Dermatophagoides farinae TaxID=6954 RepID=A0A922HV94_DERFA|nr:uncharacterized protein LOC124495199 [Dermatophagoides farinae]KAH9511035.1 hypothetical protein DERF_009521 [Dermatophagoides farinae]
MDRKQSSKRQLSSSSLSSVAAAALRPGPSSQINSTTRRQKRSQYFPLSRIRYFLENFSHCKTISEPASMACAVIIEIAMNELLHIATEVALDEGRHKVSCRHIISALHNSEWLQELFGQSGMLPPAEFSSSDNQQRMQQRRSRSSRNLYRSKSSHRRSKSKMKRSKLNVR